MTQPITTKDKDELIKSLEKLTTFNQMPGLKEAVASLKHKDTLFQANDHRKIISFILSAIETYPQIESDPNSKDLVNLCVRIVKNAPDEEPASPTPNRKQPK